MITNMNTFQSTTALPAPRLRFCALLALLASTISSIALADSAKPPVTRIVFRAITPQLSPNSFAAKPKTIYIAGESYARTEEEPDPARGIHGLMVITEPDIWMINLLDRTGRHMVDPGPTFVVHHEILKRGAPKEFAQLEFGREVAFFLANKATSLGSRELDQQRCEASEFKSNIYRIVLYTIAGTHIPFQLEVYEDEKLDFTVRYVSYQTNLPFDASLFKPPSGITFTEDASKRLSRPD
jgi:hypothetical protein